MTSRLQLHLSAKDLKNLAGLRGKSDPFTVVTVRGDNPNNDPTVAGQTDVYVQNTEHREQNPELLVGVFGIKETHAAAAVSSPLSF
jgi:hypothetical protein